MRETTQFAAVRRLHAEMREKGESPQLLAGLSRGYANLGLLTQFHWNSAPMVFKARSLLYAQRLFARNPGDTAAIRTRAYAAALAGLHKFELDDLEAAEKLGATQPKVAVLLPWVEVIDAYVHFDLRRLAAARDRSVTSLSRILQFLAAEAPEAEAATIRAGRALLATDPECYLAHDSMCRIGTGPHLRERTQAGSAVFVKTLPGRLKELPDPPAMVAMEFANDEYEPGVYTALRAAGTAAADRGEPSWGALATILQEIRFTQLLHRLDFIAEKLNADTQETALDAVAVLAGHPLLPLIDSYTFSQRINPGEVRKRLMAVSVGDLDFKASAYYYRLRWMDPSAALAWFQGASNGHGFLFPELSRQARSVKVGSPVLANLVQFLRDASPHSPITQAYTAAYGGPEVVGQLPKMELHYADNALVQWGIGQRHLFDRRFADATRCWKRWVELSPNFDAYLKLANAYSTKGEEDKWRETLEECLQRKDLGLFLAESQIRVEIARHLMRKKDFKRAESYALHAAESGAEWALLCAADCKVGLEDWKEADRFFRTASDRYGQSAFQWYFSCRATGKMDRMAAEQAVRNYLRDLGPGPGPGELFRAGRFYLLVGEDKNARAAFGRAADTGKTDLNYLFAALAADAGGDVKDRDSALAKMDSLDVKAVLKPLGPAMRQWLREGHPPEPMAVEALMKDMVPGARADAEFCVGWFLDNRGLRDRAVVHWKRCAESEAGSVFLKTHARVCLETSRDNAPAKKP